MYSLAMILLVAKSPRRLKVWDRQQKQQPQQQQQQQQQQQPQQ